MSSLRDVLDYEELPEEVRKIAEKYFSERISTMQEKLSEVKVLVEELSDILKDD